MIHYHGTPIGGKREDVARFLAGRHALVSFARPEDLATAFEVCQSVAFDNGAFSAWISGNAITDWSAYYEWVRQWMNCPHFDWAIIPDVINGAESENDALIAEWEFGWRGVPVWHLHESLDRLERLSYEWPRVALGSSGEWPDPGTRKWWERINDAMSVVCDECKQPRCKLHGLRMLDPAIFYRIPLRMPQSMGHARRHNAVVTH